MEKVARYTNLINVYEYIVTERCHMEAASKLLMEIDLNIKDVDEACGYRNILGRIKFKDYYGASASDYRKQNKVIK